MKKLHSRSVDYIFVTSFKSLLAYRILVYQSVISVKCRTVFNVQILNDLIVHHMQCTIVFCVSALTT